MEPCSGCSGDNGASTDTGTDTDVDTDVDTDIEAFLNIAIPAEDVFLVGDLAGTLGVSPVTDEDAYAQHILDQMPTVPEATCAEE